MREAGGTLSGLNMEMNHNIFYIEYVNEKGLPDKENGKAYGL